MQSFKEIFRESVSNKDILSIVKAEFDEVILPIISDSKVKLSKLTVKDGSYNILLKLSSLGFEEMEDAIYKDSKEIEELFSNIGTTIYSTRDKNSYILSGKVDSLG